MSTTAVRHVFGGERLQAFSDAVFAIVATIMVIPLKLEESEVHDNFILGDYLYHQYPRFLVYLFSFVLVVDTWYSHSRIFSVVEQVDDVIMWLNLLSLLFISFLPYGIGLVSHFQESRPEGFEVAVYTCSTIIILTGITMVVMVLYAFRKQALLHPELAGNTEIRSLKIGLLVTLLVNPILAIAAEVFIFVQTDETQIISLVFFYSMGLGSLAVRTAIYIYHRRKQYMLPEFATTIFRTVASKTRTEAFSDGLFSIVATLIVLDFTTQIPSSSNVKESHGGNLRNALDRQRFIYLAYVTSFCTVGLLWFVQYGMFQFLRKITPALSLVNTLTLCLMGGVPFVSSIYVIFAGDNEILETVFAKENETLAVRASVVLVFLMGVSQLVFWTVALNQKSECLSVEVDRYPAENLMFVKIMIIPATSGLLFLLTFSEEISTRHVYGGVIVMTPFVFLLVNAGFSLHEWSKHRAARIKQRLLTYGNQSSPQHRQSPTAASGHKTPISTTSRPSISSPINTTAATFLAEQVPLKSAYS